MAEKVAQEPDGLRRQGGGNHAVGDVNYQRSGGDPEWEGSLEYQYGKAANAFNVYAREHVRGREAGFTTAGDKRYGIGDAAVSGAGHFEVSDEGGASGVAGTIPT
ncbi:hypothetical protein ABZ413_17750 [Nocardia rhamnosiphila]|uniref:Uncharacterized protein n=1 Tax=Nocardia rhamnosiphila TaxID=426716 RepID=A0ABV2WZV8_9NOCA